MHLAKEDQAFFEGEPPDAVDTMKSVGQIYSRALVMHSIAFMVWTLK